MIKMLLFTLWLMQQLTKPKPVKVNIINVTNILKSYIYNNNNTKFIKRHNAVRRLQRHYLHGI